MRVGMRVTFFIVFIMFFLYTLSLKVYTAWMINMPILFNSIHKQPFIFVLQ